MTTDTFDPYHKWLGVPPNEQPPHYYRLLGLQIFEPDPDVIASAADRTMAHIRTFQTGPHRVQSQQILNELSTARVALLAPDKKAAYDAQLRSRMVPTTTTEAVWPTQSLWEPDDSIAPTTRSPARHGASAAKSGKGAAAKTTKASGKTKRGPARNRAPLLVAVGACAIIPLVLLLLSAMRPSASETAQTEDNAKAQKKVPAKSTLDPTRPASPLPPKNVSPPPAVEPPKPSGNPVDNPPSAAKPAAWKVPAIEGTGPSVDLLSLINLASDVVAGNWTKQSGALVSSIEDRHSRVLLPGKAPENYQLRIRGVRVEGETLGIGLVIGGRLVRLEVDGYRRRVTSLATVDSRPGDANATTQRIDDVLGGDQPYMVVCTVRGETLTVTVNEKTVLEWRGSSERLGLPYEWAIPTKGKDRLFVGSYLALHRIEEISLVALPAVVTPTAPPVILPPGSIDLLAKVHPVRDSVRGRWLTRLPRGETPAGLITPPIDHAKLRIPTTVIDNYKVTLHGVRETPKGNLMIALPVQRSQVGVFLDSKEETASGLAFVDNRSWDRVDQDNSLTIINKLLPVGEPYKIECTVRGGAIDVSVNGKPIVAWRGDSSRLSMPPLWSVPVKTELAIGSTAAVHRIDQIYLTPLENVKHIDPEPHQYLCDQPLIRSSGLLRDFAFRTTVTVNGEKSPHGIAMHPGSANTTATAFFDLDAKFREFSGQVSINDSAKDGAAAPISFRIVGDDRELWKSAPMQDRSGTQSFKVDVTNVKRLEINAGCAGSEFWAHAVWVEPILK